MPVPIEKCRTQTLPLSLQAVYSRHGRASSRTRGWVDAAKISDVAPPRRSTPRSARVWFPMASP